MFTNGRSKNQNFITTSNQRRAAVWEKIFGTDILPVLCHAPRWQVIQGQAFEVRAYDLNIARLSDMQQARFASHLARVSGRPYTNVIQELSSGTTYPIKASADIRVLEPAEQKSLLAILLSNRGRGVGKRPLVRWA